jgi:ABC-type multidrug transport system permease subunit
MIAETREKSAELPPPEKVSRKSFFTQLSHLVVREYREVTRNKIALFFRFFVNGFMGILFACIFQGIGNKGDLFSHFGAVCNLLIGTMFGSAQPILLGFPIERPVFLREYASNMYGTIPYFISKMLVELPLSFLTALETFLISYWTMGLHGNFIELVLISWLLSLTAASTALFIGCSVSSVQTAQELSPLLFVPQILFTGIFIKISLVPVWMRWLQYLCALKYAIDLASIVELRGMPGASLFLESQDIHTDQAWLYIVVLLCIFLGFRTFALLNLRRRAKFVF